MRSFLFMIVGIAAVFSSLAMAEPNAFPYDEFVKFTEKIPGEMVGDQLVIGAYLKSREGFPKIDTAKANFRIRMPDGKETPLKCEPLPEKVEDAKNPADSKNIRAGFTHKLWIPKASEAYKGGVMLNDLPAGSMEVQFPPPPREVGE